MEDTNRSLHGRKRWRNEGTEGEAAFQDATTSKVQAAGKNWNQENKRGQMANKQRQNAQNTQQKMNTTLHFQATPPMQQPLCVVRLLDSKGALQGEKEAAGRGEREELNAKFTRVP